MLSSMSVISLLSLILIALCKRLGEGEPGECEPGESAEGEGECGGNTDDGWAGDDEGEGKSSNRGGGDWGDKVSSFFLSFFLNVGVVLCCCSDDLVFVFLVPWLLYFTWLILYASITTAILLCLRHTYAYSACWFMIAFCDFLMLVIGCVSHCSARRSQRLHTCILAQETQVRGHVTRRRLASCGVSVFFFLIFSVKMNARFFELTCFDCSCGSLSELPVPFFWQKCSIKFFIFIFYYFRFIWYWCFRIH